MTIFNQYATQILATGTGTEAGVKIRFLLLHLGASQYNVKGPGGLKGLVTNYGEGGGGM